MMISKTETIRRRGCSAYPEFQSQRDCVLQPRVASSELPWVTSPKHHPTLKGLWQFPIVVQLGKPDAPTLSRLNRPANYILLALTLLVFSTLPSHAALVLNGITEPFLDVTLTAPVSGIIREKHFKEGELVKQGDVILELDKKLEEYEVARRKAVMDRSKADLDSTRVLISTTKSVSKDEADKKEMDYHVAAAEYGVASEELNRRLIVSPFSGSIAEITLQAGAACAPYQPLARVVDISRCYFVGYVEGKAAPALKLDQPVKIEVAGSTIPITAKICFISPVIDPASGLARIKAVFENSTGSVRPGVAARLTID